MIQLNINCWFVFSITVWRDGFRKFDPIPNHKTDTNNHGPFSTDNIGMNYDYPEASYARRREIIHEHAEYQKGLMYFLANDPQVPSDVRDKMAQWGLAKDEFVDNGNWPHQLYIRESRRMMGEHVMTEQDCLAIQDVPRSIGMGSYAMDSHNVQRYVTSEGFVQNEGDIGVRPLRPYQISYGSIIPKREDCTNLLVPVCVSSSHIAYGSIRMEPVFMILGHSAATAASLAIDGGLAVQDVDYDQLQEVLVREKQVLAYTGAASSDKVIDVTRLDGQVVDDMKAKLVGNWKRSTSVGKFVLFGYQHDGDLQKGELQARFEAAVSPGRYEIRYAYTPNSNRASNVPITVFHSSGSTVVKLNQKLTTDDDSGFKSLGQFQFDGTAPAVVEVSNIGTGRPCHHRCDSDCASQVIRPVGADDVGSSRIYPCSNHSIFLGEQMPAPSGSVIADPAVVISVKVGQSASAAGSRLFELSQF